ncbi:hypothetical protein BLOT_013921 [Blomia tropicalis]|nr:hypothetical protein BLOT_013921 [Blomia tropicalis]
MTKRLKKMSYRGANLNMMMTNQANRDYLRLSSHNSQFSSFVPLLCSRIKLFHSISLCIKGIRSSNESNRTEDNI